MAYKWVDETKLNAALTASADAIREKTGDTAQINFDMENETGFESAIEEIESGDDYAKANEIINGSIQYFKSYELNTINDRHFYNMRSLAFTSIPNFTGTLNNYNFYSTNSLKYLNIGKATYIGGMAIQAFNLTALIIRTKSVCTIQSINETNSGIGLGTTTIYVPDLDDNGDALPAQYKSATNWSGHASQIKGYSEATEYSASETYKIGDVCKYNYKFYGYCKEDLQPATGQAPSGTASDNAYWEYIDDIEVSV